MLDSYIALLMQR